jgi:CopZ-like zinc binding protein
MSLDKLKNESACPSCATVGQVISDQTIQAILKPEQALSLLAVGRRFCATPSCEVVYYGDDGRAVTKSEIPIRVGLKESEDPIPLCYCFGFSLADVRREIVETGLCTVPARIKAEVRAGQCSCEIKNPSGTCCLGEVNRAVKQEQEAVRAGEKKRIDLP